LPGETRLEPLLVQVSRPFRILGSIDLDPGFAAAHGLRLQDLRVWIELRDPPSRGLPPDAPTSRFWTRTLQINEKRGTFTWVCDLPHAPVVLVVSCNHGPGATGRIEIEPVSGGLAEPVIRYPGP
jgi:hypothetical protein